jgi:hypothetical protein
VFGSSSSSSSPHFPKHSHIQSLLILYSLLLFLIKLLV